MCTSAHSSRNSFAITACPGSRTCESRKSSKISLIIRSAFSRAVSVASTSRVETQSSPADVFDEEDSVWDAGFDCLRPRNPVLMRQLHQTVLDAMRSDFPFYSVSNSCIHRLGKWTFSDVNPTISLSNRVAYAMEVVSEFHEICLLWSKGRFILERSAPENSINLFWIEYSSSSWITSTSPGLISPPTCLFFRLSKHV
jgi:hypothetical protein